MYVLLKWLGYLSTGGLKTFLKKKKNPISFPVWWGGGGERHTQP